MLKVEKARVIQVIEEEKRGYKAVQLGYGKIKNSKLTKSMKGVFAKKNTEAKKKLKEFRVNDTSVYKEGNEFGLEIFKDIKFVDTRSKTIGKGFAGAMKRHNFGGLRASHGVSISHRAHGSTGHSQDPDLDCVLLIHVLCEILKHRDWLLNHQNYVFSLHLQNLYQLSLILCLQI